jgi:hypothetical protein
VSFFVTLKEAFFAGAYGVKRALLSVSYALLLVPYLLDVLQPEMQGLPL